MKYIYFFTCKKEWHAMVIQTRVFGRHFLKNKWSLSVQGKQVSVANDKIKV